jgi:hypothetical protein
MNIYILRYHVHQICSLDSKCACIQQGKMLYMLDMFPKIIYQLIPAMWMHKWRHVNILKGLMVASKI